MEPIKSKEPWHTLTKIGDGNSAWSWRKVLTSNTGDKTSHLMRSNLILKEGARKRTNFSLNGLDTNSSFMFQIARGYNTICKCNVLNALMHEGWVYQGSKVMNALGDTAIGGRSSRSWLKYRVSLVPLPVHSFLSGVLWAIKGSNLRS